jgi:hypothetical protein
MRITPTVTVINGGGWNVSNCSVPAAVNVNDNLGYELRTTVTATNPYSYFPSGAGDYITHDARLT